MNLFLSAQVGDQLLVWSVDHTPVRIGRSSRCEIPIADGSVSREHAEITREDDRWYIRDLGSRNGTRVNGAEASVPLVFGAGATLEIGHIKVSVSDHAPSQTPRYNDATVLGSSLRLRADQMLAQPRERREGSDRLVRVLAEAGRLLVRPRSLPETCESILEFVEKAIPASRYILLLREKDGIDPVQIAARTRQGRASEPLALSRSIMRTVLDECTSVVTYDAAHDPRFQGQQSIVAQAVHSALAVPLFDNEQVLGLLYVDSQDLRVTFDDAQLELVTLLANMAAVKITNTRLLVAEQERARIAQELATAVRIQRALLPHEVPRVPGWSFDAHLETCYEVGGDLYDFHVAADGRVLLVLGDVSGKGIGASLLMSSFMAVARVLYEICADVGEMATRLSENTFRNSDASRFVTGVIMSFDPATGVLHYVNAGHPSPVLVCGGRVRELEATGVPFGILSGMQYPAESIVLEPGECMAIFSDGIPEAQRGDEFLGEERIREMMRSVGADATLESVRELLLGEVRRFESEGTRTDDVTLVLVRREAHA